MGTTREYGYREYPDHLTPARGGLSNLLFDEARSLTAHANFHAAVTRPPRRATVLTWP